MEVWRPDSGCKKNQRIVGEGFTMALDFADLPKQRDLPMREKKLSQRSGKRLLRSATKVMKNAHAPYSKFRVGAAILLSNGRSFPVATWRTPPTG